MQTTLKHRVPLLLLCAWCIALLLARTAYVVAFGGRIRFFFLAWNLLLALVPVTLALALRALSARRGLPALKAAVFAGWLAFLPNAPYLVTDFVHLESRPPVPLWFDIALLASFAAAGVLLGYTSVADVEWVVARRHGRTAGRAVALGALALCGFGIYLGRYLRWNSWDLLFSGEDIARQIGSGLLDPLAYPRAWGVSIIYGAALVLGYIVLQGLARTLPHADEHVPQER